MFIITATQKEKTKHREYFYLAILFAVAFFAFFVIKPFITTLFMSIVLAFVFYPLYKILNKKIKKKTLSAMIISVVVILFFTIPLLFLLNSIIPETATFYVFAKQKIVLGIIPNCQNGCIPNFLDSYLSEEHFQNFAKDGLTKSADYIIGKASDLIFSLPIVILNIIISIILTFFFFKDGDKMIHGIKKILPFDTQLQNSLINRFKEVVSALIYGQFFIAILTGLFGGFLFFVLGLPSPVLFGIIMAILSFIPVVGAPVVWIPAVLLLFIESYITGEFSFFLKALILLIFSLSIISIFLENYLKPKIIGDKAKIHPVLILLGVVGGIHLLGIVGMIVGPLVLALLITFLKIYEREINEVQD